MENSTTVISNSSELSAQNTRFVNNIAQLREALVTFGAQESTIAQVMSSFVFAKILPNTLISRVDGGFNIGKSFLPEKPSATFAET